MKKKEKEKEINNPLVVLCIVTKYVHIVHFNMIQLYCQKNSISPHFWITESDGCPHYQWTIEL
jgi:hypothetical protein